MSLASGWTFWVPEEKWKQQQNTCIFLFTRLCLLSVSCVCNFIDPVLPSQFSPTHSRSPIGPQPLSVSHLPSHLPSGQEKNLQFNMPPSLYPLAPPSHPKQGLSFFSFTLWSGSHLFVFLFFPGQCVYLCFKPSFIDDSGSRSGNIHHHDVRVAEHHVGTLSAHTQEVCGLRWSPDGKYLASGANDNLLCVWPAQTTAGSSTQPLHTFSQHQAAVKVTWLHSVLSARLIWLWFACLGMCNPLTHSWGWLLVNNSLTNRWVWLLVSNSLTHSWVLLSVSNSLTHSWVLLSVSISLTHSWVLLSVSPSDIVGYCYQSVSPSDIVRYCYQSVTPSHIVGYCYQ